MRNSYLCGTSKALFRSLMDESGNELGAWTSDDLVEMFEHQLSSPIDMAWERNSSSNDEISSDKTHSVNKRARAFGEVLFSEQPGFQELVTIKNFAKRSLSTNDCLPHEIARVFYIWSLLRAIRAGIDGVSTLDHASVRREGFRCLGYSWLPDLVRADFRDLLHD